MRLVDLNVLLYAVNRDSPHHDVVRTWWERAVDGDEPIGLPWAVILGFVRITTNPRAFVKPLKPEQALDKVDSWLSHPNIQIVLETEDHWRGLKRLIETSGTAGNLTTDAHLAALALSYGAALVSCDADFSRFAELRLENPLRA